MATEYWRRPDNHPHPGWGSQRVVCGDELKALAGIREDASGIGGKIKDPGARWNHQASEARQRVRRTIQKETGILVPIEAIAVSAEANPVARFDPRLPWQIDDDDERAMFSLSDWDAIDGVYDNLCMVLDFLRRIDYCRWSFWADRAYVNRFVDQSVKLPNGGDFDIRKAQREAWERSRPGWKKMPLLSGLDFEVADLVGKTMYATVDRFGNVIQQEIR